MYYVRENLHPEGCPDESHEKQSFRELPGGELCEGGSGGGSKGSGKRVNYSPVYQVWREVLETSYSESSHEGTPP